MSKTKSETVIEKRKWFSTDNKTFDFLQKLGKVLMVVNGKLQLVNLNLSIDANGVVSM